VIQAIKCVSRGEALLNPTITSKLLKQIRIKEEENPKLSRNEQDLLRFIALGLDNQEIARRQCRSLKSLEAALSRLYTRLRLRNRVQAAIFAVKQGLVSLEEL